MQRTEAYNVVMLSDNFVFERGLIHSADVLSNPARVPLNTVTRPQSLADETHRQLLMQLEMGLWAIGSK